MPPPRAVRRTIVDPLFVPLALGLIAVLAAVALVGALLSPVDRNRRLLRVACFALSYLVVDVWLVLAAAGLWLRRAARGDHDDERWVQAHAGLLRRALRVLMVVARDTVGFSVDVDAAPPLLGDDGPSIVLARHGGAGDSFALAWLILERLGRVPRVVLKDVLLWDPGLDVLLTRLSGCFLPSQRRGGDGTERIAAAAAALRPGDALLLFPEGGNWTPSRHRRAVRRLWLSGRRRAARQAAQTPELLPPRPAGTAAALAARPDADVLVIAHAGLDRLTTARQVWQALPFDGRPMRVCCWRLPAEHVPRSDDQVPEWLNEQWRAVARWVDAAGRGSSSPADAGISSDRGGSAGTPAG